MTRCEYLPRCSRACTVRLKACVIEDVVVVELSLKGSNAGPLAIAAGTIAAIRKAMHAPCCNMLHLEQGKVKSFYCYSIATIMPGQLGVLGDLSASMFLL